MDHTPSIDATGALATVFCAACTGMDKLSGLIGRPVIHVAAVGSAFDVGTAMRVLNGGRHGSGVPWPNWFRPLRFEDGWDDWGVFPLEPPERRGMSPAGARSDAGRMLLTLARGTSFQEFDAQLAASLRHLRVQGVCFRPNLLEERSDMLADVVVHPRYTPTRKARPRRFVSDSQDCRLVTGFYTLDPAEDARKLLWMAVGASLAAGDGRLARWR